MDMTGERLIAAPRQKVWDALNDPLVLEACIPGCESLEKDGDQFKATASVKIGPISARFSGRVTLTEQDPPTSYRIGGEGQGGVAGFAKGGAKVTLTDEAPGTRLSYVVNAQVGGKIAQLGARLIDATSKQMADLFFSKFAAIVEAPSPDEAAAQSLTPTLASMDPTVEPTPLPLPPHAMHQVHTPASIPLWKLIPSEMFGLPIAAIIGIVLYVPVLVLLFKSSIFG